MENDRQSVEVEAEVAGAGTLKVPPGALERLTLKKGTMVQVRITTRRLSKALKDKTVTEEEIERISGLQLEPRENVTRCLTAEGALASVRTFRMRAKDVLQ